MKRILIFIAFIILCVIVCTSCMSTSNYTVHYANGEIDKDLLSEIEQLDELLIEKLSEGDFEYIMDMSSSKIQKEVENNLSVFETITNTINISSEYEYFDRYYLKINTLSKSSPITITSQNKEYYLTISGNGETFASIMLFKHEPTESLLFVVYDRINDGWEIENLYFGDYRFYGMTASEMVDEALSLKEKGHVVSACQYAYSASVIIRPAPFFQYTKENEMTEQINKIYTYANSTYVFPQTLPVSGIQVISATSQITQQGVIPVIMYITELDIDNNSEENKTLLQKEANDIHPEIAKIFTGLEDDFNLFLYKAYNEPPSDPDKIYSVYTSIVNITEE